MGMWRDRRFRLVSHYDPQNLHITNSTTTTTTVGLDNEDNDKTTLTLSRFVAINEYNLDDGTVSATSYSELPNQEVACRLQQGTAPILVSIPPAFPNVFHARIEDCNSDAFDTSSTVIEYHTSSHQAMKITLTVACQQTHTTSIR